MQVSRFVLGFLVLGACTDVEKGSSIKPLGDGIASSDVGSSSGDGQGADISVAADSSGGPDQVVSTDGLSEDSPVAQPDTQVIHSCVFETDCYQFLAKPVNECVDGDFLKRWRGCENNVCVIGERLWACDGFECTVNDGCLFDCNKDNECADGEFCDQQKHTCEVIPACSTNTDCVQPSPATGCGNGNRVLFSSVCSSGACVQQQQVLESCPLGCLDAQCVTPECSVNTDCGSGLSYHCSGTGSVPSKDVCVLGTCYTEDLTPTTCPNGCDSATGTCSVVTPQCVTDQDCGGGTVSTGCNDSSGSWVSETGKIGCSSGSCKYIKLSSTSCGVNGCDIPTGKCITTSVECTTNGDCNNKLDGTGCEGGYYVTYTTICSVNTCVQAESNSEFCSLGCTATGCATQTVLSCVDELNAGVLFRSYSDPAVYYCGSDGKKYLFPNDTTYQSWYTSYANIMQIADALMAQIADGGRVKIRPGTWLVKVTSSPEVYAVEPCGKLRKIPSEAVASSLYGGTWNTTRVVDVPDAIWGDYWDSSVEASALNPPNQYLRLDVTKSQYQVVLSDGLVHPLTSAGFNANNFQTKFSGMLPAGINYTEGYTITGFDSALFDPAQVSCP